MEFSRLEIGIREQVKLMRLMRGMSQREVARVSGISVSGYNMWERGLCGISLVRLEGVCEALGCEIKLVLKI